MSDGFYDNPRELPFSVSEKDVNHFKIRKEMIVKLLDFLQDYLTEKGLQDSLPKRGGLVVDIGCGLGMGAIAMAERGFASIGVELDPSNTLLPFALQAAKGLEASSIEGGSPILIPAAGKVLFVHGDASTDLRISSDCVDLVTAFYPSGPRASDDQWLGIYSECLRVLKPGSSIFITTEDGSREGLAKEMLNKLGFDLIASEPVRAPNVLDKCIIIAVKRK